MGGRLALLAASIVAALAVLEIACRLERGRYYLLHWPNLVLDLREGSTRYARTALSPDPELGLVPRPDHSGPDAAHDGDGMRLTPPAPGIAGRPLLLATGDSFTYGAEVADADTWPARLQGLLHLRVGNGGVPGYGLDQIVMRSEHLARELQPLAIVMAFIADDVRRTELSRFVGFDKPFFAHDGDRLTPANLPVPPPSDAPSSLSWWQRAFGWSALLYTVLDRIGWPEDWPYDSVRALPRGAGERMACPLMRRLVSLGLPVLVVAQYDPDAWSADTRLASEQRRIASVVLRCAEQAGLMTLDTHDALSAGGGARLFMPEGHLGAVGNALTARAIAGRLEQAGLPMQ
jgi:hypothetical protein